MSIVRLRSTDVIADQGGVVSFFFQKWLDRLCARLDTPARSITATADVQPNDYLILASASGGAVTVRLPAAAGNRNRVITVKKTDASGNAVTLDGDGSETIDGAATKSISTQYASLSVLCDGANWWVF